MRAAGYGKSFLTNYDSDEFVECCRKLRVLNNCRDQSAGMPITSQQYDRLTPEVSTSFVVWHPGRRYVIFTCPRNGVLKRISVKVWYLSSCAYPDVNIRLNIIGYVRLARCLW